ncbi:hypothetical protein CAPTEDRAFT_165266 [Capitella teleta]|uniref:Neurotransmitter-gated ion-channel ligand-binding domain-containing protein n=1 Tax=Capitella teleta TaxID=283909 RepID=R7TNU7_CAPTE|nr:hypothetical protein CAPTEDRAFT_165266 [Capitella teleta]|eukprot:ELT92735.1 hypothetical protein CAPTEDRAFT_165266 [Capitella teleta]
MRNYDLRVRPSMNASQALNVTFGLALAQIIDVDEKNQIITTNCWLNQAWIDYKLRWNPEKYGNIKVIRLPHDAIWKPDILLYNNADVSAYKSSISTNVIVTADGNVTWLSMMIFRSSCAINVKYFPFDEQNCSLLFASWTYDGYQVNLIKVGDDGDTSNYIPNSEWLLVKLHAKRHVVFYSCCEEPYPDVTYIIQMRRKPLFYVFNMILPCMIITLVALLGFYIPSDSGEKVTMGITTLLSMTVFLMLVTENMPPTSDVLPLIGLYYGITIAIVSLATAMTVLTLNIHHKGARGMDVPPLIKKIFIGVFAKLLCLRLEVPEPVEQDTNESKYELRERVPENGGFSPRFAGSSLHNSSRYTDTLPSTISEGKDFERQFSRVLHKVHQTIDKNDIRLAEQDRRDIVRLEWQQVALVVDRILLLVFLAILLGVTGSIMFQAPHSFHFLFGDPEDSIHANATLSQSARTTTTTEPPL